MFYKSIFSTAQDMLFRGKKHYWCITASASKT